MSDFCTLQPISAFLSTNLNSKITSYNRLLQRVLWQLGAPAINIEVARDSIYENISVAADLYTTYAGLSDEYLVFNSSLYTRHQGIRLDNLFSIRDSLSVKTPENSSIIDRNAKLTDTTFNSYVKTPDIVYTCIENVSISTIENISALSSIYTNGINKGRIINKFDYGMIINKDTSLSANFIQSQQDDFSIKGVLTPPVIEYDNSFDYDIMDYRKVNSIVDLNMGESTGINTLFTIEQTLAQQTYFSYAMGNYGFDLISWYVLKNWLDTRQKMLSIDPTYTFNNRTQIMTLYPEPKNSVYWAVLHCRVERPLKDILKEQWVQKYVLALTKITLANIRGKFGNLSLFGGGSLNYNDLMSQGIKEKEELERDLFEGSAPGLGSTEPPMFFIG